MFKVPVLLYSSLCKYSSKLLDSLPDNIASKIIIINIDRDPVTKERPRIYHDIQDIYNNGIKVVPTLVISDTVKLEGRQVFQWVKHQIQSVNKPSATAAPPSHPPERSLPKQNTEESFTRLSNIQFDVTPISHEEEMALKSGRGLSSITDDKHVVSENYENVMAQRRKEQEEVGKNRYIPA
jgi:hypothetical protein